MQKIFYSFFILFIVNTSIYAQHTEYNFAIGSGFYHYEENIAIEPYYSMLNTTFDPATISRLRLTHPTYANNPFGNRSGFSYQISFNKKRITKHNFLWNFNLEYESVQCKKNVDWIYDPSLTFLPASGECTLRNNFIAGSYFFGRRTFIKKYYWDIMGGVGFGYNFFNAHEKANAIVSSTNELVACDFKSKDFGGQWPSDFKFQLHSELGYKNWGI